MKKALIILLAVLFLFSCTEKKEPEEEPEGGNEMENGTFEALLKKDYGFLSLSILGAEEGVYEYRLVLEAPEGEEWVSKKEWIIRSTYLSVSSYVNWFCQETGYEGMLRFAVYERKNGKELRKAVSASMETSETFPKEEVLSFNGKNIPEDVWNFAYSGNGDSMDMIFSYSVSKEDGEIIYRADYFDKTGRHEKEKKLKEKDYEEFLELLEKGRIERKYYSDPEYQRLDGSDVFHTILWESETLMQQNNYVYRADEPVMEAIEEWLISKR